MALVPSQIEINDTEYTRVINGLSTYLIQNVGSGMIYIVASDTDLGLTSTDDLGGYKISPLSAIDNTQLQDYTYVYAKSVKDKGTVRV